MLSFYPSSLLQGDDTIRNTLARGLLFVEAAYGFGCPVRVSGMDYRLEATGTIVGLPRIGVHVDKDSLGEYVISEDINDVTRAVTWSKRAVDLIPPPHYFISGLNIRVQGYVDGLTFDTIFDHPECNDALVFRFGETYLPLKSLFSTKLHIRKRIYSFRESGIFETIHHRSYSIQNIKRRVIQCGPCLLSMVLET